MVRLALIGCGRNAAVHLAAARQVTGATLTAVADLDPERAAQTAQSTGVTVHARTLDELLATAADTFDAVIVNTPNDSHGPLAERAARAGKHVLAEKPLALTSEAAAATAATCQQAGVRLMVAQTMRFMAAQREVKQSLDAGELGRPGLLRIHRWMPLFLGGWKTWKIDPTRNGGMTVHEGVHEIDLALWMFGGIPTQVYATARTTRAGGLELPDYLQMHLGFGDGGMAMIDLAFTMPRGDRYGSLSLIGSLGTAYADDHHNMQLLYRGGRPNAVKTDSDRLAAALQLDEFVRAITDERQPAVTGEDARAALLVAEAVDRSLSAGEAITLVEGRDERA